MADKKIILLIGFLMIIAGTVGLVLIERDFDTKSNIKNIEITPIKPQKKFDGQIKKNETPAKKINLYNDFPYSIPLASIVEISCLPENIKKKINSILEISQGCYFIKQNPLTKDVYVFLQNPATDMSERYMRHNLQIAHLNKDGDVFYEDIGYIGEYGEITNAIISQNEDEWIFDETVEPKKPVKHIKYNDKQILYTEEWNYDENEPVKYEMKNAEGTVISLMKELVSDDSGLRQEHIFYDNNGNTIKSLTVNYDGADIVWFKFYDSNSPEKSMTIESVYNNGEKSYENIYNDNYELTEKIIPAYTDGNLISIKVFDSNNNEIKSFIKE